jgi:malonate decarboxylase alpha subunit
VIRPGDRVCLEGDNQKQADFLAEVLAGVDPSRIHDLHIVQSGIVLQAHLDLFERGIARKLDFSYSGPQGARSHAHWPPARSSSARSIPISSCSPATLWI